MRCPWCGAVIADGSRFCPVCGRQVQGAKSKRRGAPRALLVATALLVSVAIGIGGGVALSGALSGDSADQEEREASRDKKDSREDEDSRETGAGLWGGADEQEESGELSSGRQDRVVTQDEWDDSWFDLVDQWESVHFSDELPEGQVLNMFEPRMREIIFDDGTDAYSHEEDFSHYFRDHRLARCEDTFDYGEITEHDVVLANAWYLPDEDVKRCSEIYDSLGSEAPDMESLAVLQVGIAVRFESGEKLTDTGHIVTAEVDGKWYFMDDEYVDSYIGDDFGFDFL